MYFCSNHVRLFTDIIWHADACSQDGGLQSHANCLAIFSQLTTHIWSLSFKKNYHTCCEGLTKSACKTWCNKSSSWRVWRNKLVYWLFLVQIINIISAWSSSFQCLKQPVKVHHASDVSVTVFKQIKNNARNKVKANTIIQAKSKVCNFNNLLALHFCR